MSLLVLAVLSMLILTSPLPCMAEEGDILSTPSTDENSDNSPFFFHMVSPSAPGNADLTAAENAWGRFAPQSWARYQTTVVAGGENVSGRSLTEVKQILERVDEHSYTIKRCVSVQTGAQELIRRPESITYNFYDRSIDPDLVSISAPCDNISINIGLKNSEPSLFKEMGGLSRVVPCYVRIFNKRIENRREETKVWYSPVVFPYLLKQQSRVFILPDDIEGEETLYRSSTTEIWKSPVDLRFGLIKDWMTTMTETDANEQVRVRATTFHSSQIPGGVLGETAVEYDSEGREVLRSESRLLDYYAAPM